MEPCIFCRIVKGEIPCARLLETDEILAFLDIAPVRKGHALVISKAHHPTIWDLPPELGQAFFSAMSRVGEALLSATGAEGLNIMMNNLEAAGQLVHHAHFHLIPRLSGDGLALWPQLAYDSPEEMSALAGTIRSRMK